MLNFEVAVVMYDNKIANQLESQFTVDLKHAIQIELTDWTKRPIRQVLGENICRLFAPLL